MNRHQSFYGWSHYHHQSVLDISLAASFKRTEEVAIEYNYRATAEALNESFVERSANSWHWKLISFIRGEAWRCFFLIFIFFSIFHLQFRSANYARQCQELSLSSWMNLFSRVSRLYFFVLAAHGREINAFLISIHVDGRNENDEN